MLWIASERVCRCKEDLSKERKEERGKMKSTASLRINKHGHALQWEYKLAITFLEGSQQYRPKWKKWPKHMYMVFTATVVDNRE